jgi:trans-aconitate 2-methyltransferase
MEWNPDDYARNSSAQLAWANELIARLRLSGSEDLLDVGCGDGKITAAFAANVPHGSVLGVDSSAAFVAYARAHYPPSAFANLSFTQMDARRLAANHPFDLIFSNAVLHWVDDQPAFLSGCARLLKPGGRLVISCGGAGNASGVVAVLNELTGSPRWAEYFCEFVFPYYFHSPVQYAAWLEQAGLSAARLELVEKDMTHVGQDGLAGWLRTTWFPYTRCVPDLRREDFITECVRAYLERAPLDNQGRSHVKMVRLEVEAFQADRP